MLNIHYSERPIKGNLNVGGGLTVLVLTVLTGCGVEFLKPLTPDQMAIYPDVIALAKDRYTGTRVSGPLPLSGWSVTSTDTRDIASFQIPSNTTGADADYKAFARDMAAYCAFKGGHYEDFSTATAARWQALRQQNTQVVESKILGSAAFECGPPGRGTISNDWTQYNPSMCRQLYTNATDMRTVRTGMGDPPNFGCTSSAGALFIGKALTVPGSGAVVTIQVRINQGRGATTIPYTDFPQVE